MTECNHRQKLAKLGQDHLLAFWHELEDEDQAHLHNQLFGWDLEELLDTFNRSMQLHDNKNKSTSLPLSALPSHQCLDRRELSKDELRQFRQLGLKAIASGKVAVCVLAGGQGSRLGFPHPKGMYDVGLPSGKSLFRIQAERLLRLQTLAHEQYPQDAKPLHWFVMTSKTTHDATLQYFRKHAYFGLEAEQVHFFQQACAPCFSLDGKLLLADKHVVAESPDGNGGLYTALHSSGSLDEMQKLGIEYVHVYCVDNILIRVADPEFIGYCIQRSLHAVGKAVEKRSHDEPVGVFGLVDGKLKVLEYSEISEEQAKATDEKGRLKFRLGNICNHLFTLDFLQKVAQARLPAHVAKKKIPFFHVEEKKHVKPNQVNGIKLEKFVFDVFELTNDFGIWLVDREEEFSPVKNSVESKEDTPNTARDALYKLHSRFVEKAGGTAIPGPEIGLAIVEISPLLSYEGESIEPLVEGKKLASPLVIFDSKENRENTIKLVE